IAPGILIGSGSASLLLNIGPHAGFGVTGVACALLMSSADVLQSWLVSRLNRGLLSRNLLISLKPTIYFVGSIFLCCGISSSVGVNTLFRLGIIPEVELAKSWAFWWMGDSIGMLVITSLLAWLLIPRIRNNNTQAQAFLLLCAVVGVVLFSVSALGYIERTNAAPLIRGGDDLRPWYMPSWLQISALALGAMLITLLAAYLRARQKN